MTSIRLQTQGGGFGGAKLWFDQRQADGDSGHSQDRVMVLLGNDSDEGVGHHADGELRRWRDTKDLGNGPPQTEAGIRRAEVELE